MTAGGAATRVWTGAAGVAMGTLWSSHGIDGRVALACAAVGALSVALRRRPTFALAGIFFVAAGLAALHPVDRTSRYVQDPSGGFARSLEAAFAEEPDRPAALIAGLTIGDTSGVDYPTTETFRRSGLSHLVAVSGSNVAIVLAAIAIVTARLPLVLRCVLAAVGLGFYVAVVGPEPSVLRAAAMGIVGLLAYVVGRRAAPLNGLGLAVIAVVAAKPELLFSIGLHLSVAATFGIVVWSQPIATALRRVPGLLRAPMAITLAAQIAVAPLLIAVFERLSLVGPVANVLAAPAVPPATVLGLAAGIVGFLSPPLSRLLAAVTVPFAEWILWVADRTAAWSWASVDVPAGVGWALGVPLVALALAGAGRG